VNSSILKPEYVTVSKRIDKSLVDRLVLELSVVPDYRDPRGRPWPLAKMLACFVLAKLCGAQTAADVARWMADRGMLYRWSGCRCSLTRLR
jgi:hypothetical protein